MLYEVITFQAQLHVVAQIRPTRRPLAAATPTAAKDVAKYIAKDIAEIGPAESTGSRSTIGIQPLVTELT